MKLVKIIEDTADRTISILDTQDGGYRVVKSLKKKFEHTIKDFENSPRVWLRALSYAMKLARTLE